MIARYTFATSNNFLRKNSIQTRKNYMKTFNISKKFPLKTPQITTFIKKKLTPN
jgi:hypothetical protein